jgi:hypothetical protein
MIKRQLLNIFYAVLFFFMIVQMQTNLFAQDSIKKKNMLVVERKDNKQRHILLKNGTFADVPPRIFFEGKKVVIKTYDNNRMVQGKIESISDSSITIRKSQIKISQIKSISSYRGIEPIMLGVSMLAAGISFGQYFADYPDNEYGNSTGVGGMMVSVMVAFLGGCTTLFGIVEIATIKYYRMDKNYKLIVKPVE